MRYDPTVQLLEEDKISKNLTIKKSTSFSGDTIFLDIIYMNGKFTMQKIFTNTYDGRLELEKTRKEFNTEEKVRKYLGL